MRAGCRAMIGRRFFRLTLFGIFALVFALIAIDITLAWIYISALTHPACPIPRTLDNISPPEEHWLLTEDGLTLRAWYYPSENGRAILTAGGLGGSLGQTLPPVKSLIRAGYGVLQVDTRACADPPARVTLGADEIYDAAAGLEFLIARPEIDPQRIGAFGFSMGAVTLIRASARQPRIRALIAEGGYANLGEHITQPGAEKSLPRQVFLYTVAETYWLQTGVNPWLVSPRDDLASIGSSPVLLIYGEGEIERGGGWEQFKAAHKPKALWVVPGGDHGSNHLAAPQEYERRVLEFFEQELGE